MRVRLLLIAALMVCAGAVASAQFIFRLPAAAPGTANLWVDTDGETCTRSGSPAAYASASACDSFSAATSAATSGDTIRVKAGTYGGQGTIGASGKTLTYIGEGPTSTVIDSGTANGSTGSPSAYNTLNFSSNTTVESIGVTGDYPIVGFFG